MLNGSQVERLVASFVNRSLHRQAAIVLERLGGVLTEPQVTLLLTQQLNSVGAAKVTSSTQLIELDNLISYIY